MRASDIFDKVPTEWLVYEMIRRIGDDPDRPGLAETPERVRKSWHELYGGYIQDPKAVLKTFEEQCSDEMVLVRGTDVVSICEHHLLPFVGKGHVAYIPGPTKRVVGLSKVVRLVEVFARRLQLQERLTDQITDALMGPPLEPLGAACVIEAVHSCMMCRGVRQRPVMVTSSLKGVFRDKVEVRAEFFNLVNHGGAG